MVDPAESLAANACRGVLDPLAPLHDAVPDLLRTERLSSVADASAVLGAVAGGETSSGTIAARAGLEGSRADYVLKELQALEVLVKVVRAGDRPGSRYTRYRCADPFTAFWSRFVSPNRGALHGTSAPRIWSDRIAPWLDDHMGPIFEQVCSQAVLGALFEQRLGPVDAVNPWWSRDGRTEIDLVVEAGEQVVCCECKWRARGRTGDKDLRQLRDHVVRHPVFGRREDVGLGLFSSGGFTEQVRRIADAEGVLLVGPEELLPR